MSQYLFYIIVAVSCFHYCVSSIVQDDKTVIPSSFSDSCTYFENSYPYVTSSQILVGGYYANQASFGNITATSNSSSIDAFFGSIDLQSKQYNWLLSIGGGNIDTINSFTVDSLGRYLVVGSTLSTQLNILGSSFTTQNGKDSFLIKLLPDNGALMWLTPLGGLGDDSATEVAVDTADSIIVGGTISGNTSWGGSQLTPKSTDWIIAKYAGSNGTCYWSYNFGGAVDDVLNDVAVDSSNNIIAVGYFKENMTIMSSSISSTSASVLIIKFHSNGTILWFKNAGGIADCVAYGTTTDSKNNVYVTGRFTKTLDFSGGASIMNSTIQAAFLVKFSSNGTYLWQKQFGSTQDVLGESLSTCSDDSILFSGSYQGTASLDGSFLPTSSLYFGGFTWKLNSAGSVIWGAGFPDGSVLSAQAYQIPGASINYTMAFAIASNITDLTNETVYLNTNGDIGSSIIAFVSELPGISVSPSTTPSATPSLLPSSSTSPIAPTPSESPSNTMESSSSVDTEAVAAGVGAGGGSCVLIVVVAGVFWCRKKRNKDLDSTSELDEEPIEM